jgi:predicted MFS family arabinose efflux permease
MYLIFLGNSQSAIGRILMLFGLLIFVVSPLAPSIVTRFKRPEFVAIFCSLVIVCVLLIGYMFQSTWSVVVGICLYTIASVIHVSSMMSILDKFSEENSKEKIEKYTKDSVLSFYFISERIAMVSGPALVSIVLSISDFSKTMLVMAGGLFLCNAFYMYAIWAAQFKKNNEKGYVK